MRAGLLAGGSPGGGHVLFRAIGGASSSGVSCYHTVAVPNPDRLGDEGHPLHGVYKFKAGFGGEVADFVGRLKNLPVGRRRAEIRDRLEPAYYRLRGSLKGGIYL